MGQNISVEGFDEADFVRFRERLLAETGALREAFAQNALSQAGPYIGMELEAWLIDRNFYPAPHNQTFLKRLADPSVVPEFSRFNIELNSPVEKLAGRGLGNMHEHISATLRRCSEVAHDEVDRVIAIGTLPTLREQDLSLDVMTPSRRYTALNREAMRARGGGPLQVEIDSAVSGAEDFSARYNNVMLEAAATSLQLHLQVPPAEVSRYYNASVMLAGPLIAAGANAPFLFGQPLWHETRIAVFEQALAQPGGPARVTLGDAYAPPDFTALFADNAEDYPVFLPVCDDEPAMRFSALRIQNGTIWRWVRPLVGFDTDGTPHLRIEQRVLPAGPSVLDMMANAALYFGAVHEIAAWLDDAEAVLPFAAAKANFYAAARYGMGAEMHWPGTSGVRPAIDLLEKLIPIAETGLRRQGMDDALIDKYMATVATRIASGRNGALWQLSHYERYGDLYALTAAYLENQRSGLPVHEWPL